MARNLLLQLFAHFPSPLIGRICMNNKGQGIHLFLVDQNIQLHQLRRLIALHIIIKGCIASGAGFQCIKEIVNDLIQRQLIF